MLKSQFESGSCRVLRVFLETCRSVDSVVRMQEEAGVRKGYYLAKEYGPRLQLLL